MTSRHRFAISQHALLEVCHQLPHPRNKGRAGMPGARCTRGLVCSPTKENAHEHTGPPKSPGIPARNGFTDYVVLSPARPPGLSPSPAEWLPPACCRLVAAGPHAFSVRVGCSTSKSTFHVHHSPPRVCDDRETPLCLGRDSANIGAIFTSEKQ